MARVTDEKPIPVGLSTASVWPLKAGTAFALAAELGYDGVEEMVWADPASQDVSAFRPSIDPTDVGFRHYTLDLSHTAAARMDALALAERMGEGLSHVHLADGTGLPKDEHLVPGRGGQPCTELLEKLDSSGFAG